MFKNIKIQYSEFFAPPHPITGVLAYRSASSRFPIYHGVAVSEGSESLRPATVRSSTCNGIERLDSVVAAIADISLRWGFASRGLMRGCVPLIATRVCALPHGTEIPPLVPQRRAPFNHGQCIKQGRQTREARSQKLLLHQGYGKF